ncbi:unnamed protein product [Arabis nemorensis]|uniref:Retrotransposon gag domain-containing protein n=1 Tax=Arabis nemorensis TaxID=586526 RepID=A0A565BP15_9BRAS|nr:unnamed protein product [Arabis nemorensis]
MECQTEDADLWTLNQGPTETLRSFIDRFKAVLSKVRGLSDKDVIQALKKSLWHEPDYRKEIALNRHLTIQDAMHRATEFTANEEDVKNFLTKTS